MNDSLMTNDPRPTTLFGWFARTARELPREIAIDATDRQISYAELDQLSARVADKLSRLGLPTRSRIGLVGTRKLETYAAYLGILRLGHTVVPISPEAPINRNAAIAAAARVATVVLSADMPGELPSLLSGRGLRVMAIRSADEPADPKQAVRGELDSSDPESIAYLLFTSGSTGRPKGVPISNRQVSAYLEYVIRNSDLRPGMRTSHTFSLTFDPSIFDLFATWGAGATMVLPHRRELLIPASYAARRQLTHWYSVPSLISYALRTGSLAPGSMPSIRRSMFIGEQLTLRQAAAWQAAAAESVVENVYGPAELTVSCSAYALPPNLEQWPITSNGTVPIGTIYPHLEWLVVGPEGRPDNTGELLVRGPQRFDGYLDISDSQGRFGRWAPAAGHVLPKDSRIAPGDFYRTGDRVQVRDGVLVHLGRIDRQVKIDGHRIELAEIETALRRHSQVTDAAVVAVANPAGQGSALVGALCGEQIGGRAITAFLAETLPKYMVPRVLFWIPEMPLNISGKKDYKQIAARARQRLHQLD